MWIGNYICLRKICDTEIIILKNTNLIVKRLWKKKKIVYEKKIFYDEIFKIYYEKQEIKYFPKDNNKNNKSLSKISFSRP